MLAFRVVPEIYYIDTVRQFHEEFQIGKRDLLVTSERPYKKYVEPLGVQTNVIMRGSLGHGEPTDEMIDALAKEARNYDYDRIIALGGGSVVDICKVLALDVPERSIDLFTGAAPLKKVKKLIAIPTTCGTGSEVTNVSIAELISLNIKKGIAAEETYADVAVLIPETMAELPWGVFATSSVDALIHCVESFLSPKATPFTEMYSREGIRLIMNGYRKILDEGKELMSAHIKDFALAANYGGIAFGNAGCGAVHALSYSIGGAFHVTHGEANYQFFTEVMKNYVRRNPGGKIQQLSEIFADVLGVSAGNSVYEALDSFLGRLISKKKLREYGMNEEQIALFAKSTTDNQQRLLANNYVSLCNSELEDIFRALY
jgi:4-hydroxybutyrate dehydrogenase